MINIKKNPHEPPLLHKHRTSMPGATYDNGPKEMKSEILAFLIAEQYGLCCYCQQQISMKSASVEHKLSQDNYPDRALDYNNMAGACSCSEGQEQVKQYCDDFKGNKDFTFDLSDIEKFIQYEPKTGIIKSVANAELDRQLNDVLNLNQDYLKKERINIYNAMKHFIRKNAFKKDFKGVINNEIKRYETVVNGQKRPFCGIMLYFLKKRYDRMKSRMK